MGKHSLSVLLAMKDYYNILGVDADCSLSDIKDAYRKLSKKFHPDLNQGDPYFENRFKEVQEAYDILSSTFNRTKYDNELRNNRSSYQQYQAKPSAFKKFKRRGPGLGLSIVLVLIAIIGGAYLFKWFSTSKNKTNYPVAFIPGNTHVHHRHKKKVRIDNSSRQNLVIRKIDQPKLAPVVSKVISPNPAPAIVTPSVITRPDSINTKQTSKEFLYTTYIRPNATGIINMRAEDSYSSRVIETIPGNSKVLVLAKGDAYYKVSFNDRVGYVPKWALQVK